MITLDPFQIVGAVLALVSLGALFAWVLAVGARRADEQAARWAEVTDR